MSGVLSEPADGMDIPTTTVNAVPKGRSVDKPAKVVPATRAGFTWRKSASAAKVSEFLELFTPEVIDQPLIRLGSKHDGGYLIPDDLDGI